MKKILIVASLMCCALHAMAGPAADAVNTCLADGTNGKERKALARWIFLGMSMHPEMRGLTSATALTREDANRAVGQVFTRLVTETCPKEFRALAQAEGQAALVKAFEFLGRLAMQELMTNDEAKGAFGEFEKFVDRAKIAEVLGSK